MASTASSLACRCAPLSPAHLCCALQSVEPGVEPGLPACTPASSSSLLCFPSFCSVPASRCMLSTASSQACRRAPLSAALLCCALQSVEPGVEPGTPACAPACSSSLLRFPSFCAVCSEQGIEPGQPVCTLALPSVGLAVPVPEFFCPFRLTNTRHGACSSHRQRPRSEAARASCLTFGCLPSGRRASRSASPPPPRPSTCCPPRCALVSGPQTVHSACPPPPRPSTCCPPGCVRVSGHHASHCAWRAPVHSRWFLCTAVGSCLLRPLACSPRGTSSPLPEAG